MSYLDYLSALDVVHWVPRNQTLEGTVDPDGVVDPGTVHSGVKSGESIVSTDTSKQGSFNNDAINKSSVTNSPVNKSVANKPSLNNDTLNNEALNAGTRTKATQKTEFSVKRDVISELPKHEKTSLLETASNSGSGQNPDKELANSINASENQQAESTNNSTASTSECYLVAPQSQRWLPQGVLVLCRHQPEQPPESFLNRSRPSKTVKNLLAALNWLVVESDSLNDIEMPPVMLAQVASTALGDDAIGLEEMIKLHQPKAMLLLGSATANHLSGQQKGLAEWSLKTWTHDSGTPFFVIHHPYELFSDPLLKKQAMQQLLQLRQLLVDLNGD